MKIVLKCDRWLKTKILNKIFEKLLRKYFGVDIKIKIRGFSILQDGDNYNVHLNVDGQISKEEVEKIFAK